MAVLSRVAHWRDPWWFRARLIRVVDGDTYWMDMDLGFRVSSHHSIRLWGLDTP